METKIQKISLTAVLALASVLGANAQVKSQKIGDNPTMIQQSAALEVESTSKGVLIPRLALTSVTDATTITGGNIASLLVYNTATAAGISPGFYYWNGTAWTRIVSSADIASLVAATETVTTLVDNGNGTATYTNEDGDATTINIAAMVVANEVDGVIGNEILNTTTNMGLTRSGSGTAASPYTVGITPGTATGQVMTWDGTAWVSTALPAAVAEVDGIIGNEVTDAVANGGLTRMGTGTTADPYKLKINNGTTAGQVLTWDGTEWLSTALPAEVDGSVTNEIQALSIAGDVVSLSNGGGSVTLPAEVDGSVTNEIQALSIAGNVVSLSNGGGSVTLPAQTTSPMVNNANGTYTYTDETGAATTFPATAEPWFDVATGTAATANTQNIYQMGNVGIGIVAPTSKLHSAGSMAMPISSSAASISLDNTMHTVRLDATAGDVTITLPAAASASGRIYNVIKSDASANKLIFSATIQANGYTFTQANVPGEYVIQSDGTNWVLVH